MNRKDKLKLERYQKKLELVKSGAVANPFETPKEKADRIERIKKDVKYMVEYYFPHYATAECADFHVEWAKFVKKNDTFKGFSEWGRGLAKSVWNNIIIPFWLHINGVPSYFVVIGNSYDKAEQLLEDIKAEFEANERIINDFGEQRQIGNWEDGFFITKSGFIGQALGMGQSVRGLRIKSLRPTHINCDDMEDKKLAKNPKRQNEMVKWIERDLIPTMDGKYRRFTYSNNRFAPRMIQTELQKKHPKWKVHRVNAYNPVTYAPSWHQKYDNNYYRDMEVELGVLPCKAEYNNDPHIDGEIFTETLIQWVKLPRIDSFDMIVGHWDVAYAGSATSDFNAVRIWGSKDKKFYLIDCFLKQTTMRPAIDYMFDFQQQHPDINIHWRFESQFWNGEVERTIQEAEAAFEFQINLNKVDTAKTHKYDRILSLHPYYQNSRIYYNEKLKAHNDTQEGLAQLFGIEPGYNSHDDAPDADQQAIQFLSYHLRTANYTAPIIGKFNSQNRF
jgi:predicted phage terminase large subunit-like protein